MSWLRYNRPALRARICDYLQSLGPGMASTIRRISSHLDIAEVITTTELDYLLEEHTVQRRIRPNGTSWFSIQTFDPRPEIRNRITMVLNSLRPNATVSVREISEFITEAPHRIDHELENMLGTGTVTRVVVNEQQRWKMRTPIGPEHTLRDAVNEILNGLRPGTAISSEGIARRLGVDIPTAHHELENLLQANLVRRRVVDGRSTWNIRRPETRRGMDWNGRVATNQNPSTELATFVLSTFREQPDVLFTSQDLMNAARRDPTVGVNFTRRANIRHLYFILSALKKRDIIQYRRGEFPRDGNRPGRWRFMTEELRSEPINYDIDDWMSQRDWNLHRRETRPTHVTRGVDTLIERDRQANLQTEVILELADYDNITVGEYELYVRIMDRGRTRRRVQPFTRRQSIPLEYKSCLLCGYRITERSAVNEAEQLKKFGGKTTKILCCGCFRKVQNAEDLLGSGKFKIVPIDS